MDAEEPESDRRLRRWTLAALTLGLCLCGGGFALWLPAAGHQSTACSDLGLALIGGGLAIIAGAGIAYVVSDAERRFDVALRRREDVAARANLIMSLTMSNNPLDGVDLGGRDLEGAYFGGKPGTPRRMRGANLTNANLNRATLQYVNLTDSRLKDAQLRHATLDHVNLTDADLTGAVLANATLRGHARGASFDRSDLRGADLSALKVVIPAEHIDSSGRSAVVEDDPEAIRAASRLFAGVSYDNSTIWPTGVTPNTVPGARRS